MLTALRKQVQTVLYAVPTRRKPALRRSDAVDALFATDLPLVAEESDVAAFVRRMKTRGWTIRERNGWLTLDAEVPVPQSRTPLKLIGECGCCISLLLRHLDTAPERELVRAVVKAADEGRQPFERVCARIHGILAIRLRRHEPLPLRLVFYLNRAHEMFYSEEATK